LSDVGNLRERMEDRGINYPGGEYNYSDGRFTNSSDTKPASDLYVGVWHEQLSRTFLARSAETPSLNGGNVFAFGGATTRNGTQDFTLIGFFGNNITVTIDNIGKQVDDYITRRTLDPAALFVVWGGGNDLFDSHSAENVTATAGRVAMLVSRLADAGARHFFVPNVPPLGGVPRYGDDRATQDAKNKASSDYRAQLKASLDGVASTFASQGISANIYRLDVWSLFVRFVADPTLYGFTDHQNTSRGRDGADPDKYLFWDDIHPTTAGHFQIAKEANRVLTGSVTPPAKAVNVSTRVTVSGGENVSIGGFIVRGNAPKRIVARGIGPSLAAANVQGPLPDPVLELVDSAGQRIQFNDNWRDEQASEILLTGVAPTDDRESAIVRTLPPGAYTVILSGKGTAAGVGLVEVYDLDSGADSTLANLSTRGAVGVGEDVMIGGVIIENGGDPIVVVRAIGPSLASAGVTNPLLDPILELYDANGTMIGLNDNWKQGQPTAAKATLLAPTDERESAMTASLAPGNYTAVVRGKNNTTGVALVEVYRIP
jgi:phospholipase/lecithinase/hemolysin